MTERPEQDADLESSPSEEPLEEGRTPPPEDIESDPAYNPDDPDLERAKGG